MRVQICRDEFRSRKLSNIGWKTRVQCCPSWAKVTLRGTVKKVSQIATHLRGGMVRKGEEEEGAMRTWHFWFPASTYSLCSHPPTYLCVFSVSTRLHKPCRPPSPPPPRINLTLVRVNRPLVFPLAHRHRDSSISSSISPLVLRTRNVNTE